MEQRSIIITDVDVIRIRNKEVSDIIRAEFLAMRKERKLHNSSERLPTKGDAVVRFVLEAVHCRNSHSDFHLQGKKLDGKSQEKKRNA